MDRLREFLNAVKGRAAARRNFLGLAHVLIGRRVTLADGTPVSSGLTWRELAALLKKVRWDKEAVRDVGLDPADLPPRDRQRYWYNAIAHSQVDSPKAIAAGERLIEAVRPLGYVIGEAPGK
jgi:hypothetical protein